MPKRSIPDTQAKKIKRAEVKVRAHNAREAGSLHRIFQAMGVLVKLLADASVEVDEALAAEVRIVLHVLDRFQKRIRSLSDAKAGSLKLALSDLMKIHAQLKQASGPYGIKRLQAESQRDLEQVKKLQRNLQIRAREAAFVLAELEQAADPVTDLKLASAAQRRRNDRVKAKAIAVEAKPDTMTS